MNIPRLIFWEMTRVCNLGCIHCRASALFMGDNPGQCLDQRSDDLTKHEAFKLIDEIVSFSNPILVLSGGEPLIRDDVYEIAEYGTHKGLKVVLATNATLITDAVADKLKVSGIKRISVSIYGADKDIHDGFTGQSGIFVKTLKGIHSIKKAGISLQINTTITKKNLNQIKPLIDFAMNIGADAFHVFYLVPTGRGKQVAGDEISGEEYEQSFIELSRMSKQVPIHIKVTCAPHYYRVVRQQGQEDVQKTGHHGGRFAQVTKGCLAGTGVCFVSHKGEVFPCGYFQRAAGNIRKESFVDIWNDSPLFLDLRDDSKLKGKCGICEFKKVCGGCRARAYERTGDYLQEEPHCIYTPHKVSYKAM